VVTTNQLELSRELRRSLQAYKSCSFLISEKHTNSTKASLIKLKKNKSANKVVDEWLAEIKEL
jgi:hypothetical protein